MTNFITTDTDKRKEENKIQLFFHCGACMPDKPDHISPQDWARLEAGWTILGLQVWCKRCNSNIIHVDFEGTKHPADTTRLP